MTAYEGKKIMLGNDRNDDIMCLYGKNKTQAIHPLTWQNTKNLYSLKTAENTKDQKFIHLLIY